METLSNAHIYIIKVFNLEKVISEHIPISSDISNYNEMQKDNLLEKN